MSKTKEQILATFKKANKERRERMAKKAGYKSVDDYKAYLQGKDTTLEDEKPVVHIVNILDKSSSMGWGGKMSAALSGLNNELNELKNETDVDYIYSLVTFSNHNRISRVIDRAPLASVSTIFERPDGGTAMYDAIGFTLTSLGNTTKNGERVLVKIFTDGEENDSRRFKSTEVEKLIEEVKSFGFTVTFVGTENDVKEVVNRLSVDRSNTLVHDNTSRGITMSFMASVDATKNYSKKVLNNEDVLTGFYKSTDETL